MAVRVEETYEAHTRKINAKGAVTSAEIIYLVFEAENEDAALAAVLNAAPEAQGDVPLNSIEIDSRETETTFKVKAVYEDEDSGSGGSSSGDDDDEEDTVMSFDCGGGTKHLTHSIKQTKVKGDIDAGGAINWNGKFGSEMQISGLDVPTAQLRETYTKNMKVSKLTTAFKRKVASLVGKVNSGSFKGWSAGEVMFLGMSYSTPDKKSQKVQVTFNFSIQPNESTKVGGVSVSKKGFEYAWAIQGSTAEGSAAKVEPKAVYVDQVCEYESFSGLGI